MVALAIRALVLCAIPLAQGSPASIETEYDPQSLYRKVTNVNTSECLEKVRSLPLRVFEFAYDTVKGRRQLGVIGSELESILPESVDVVRQQAFKNPDSGAPGTPALVKLSNFPVVDKNVLFMYNVGAVQHLIARQHQLDALVAQLERLEREARMNLELLEGRIDAEVEEQAVEAAKKLEAEAGSILTGALALEAKAEEERLSVSAQGEAERATVDHEAKLVEERLAAEDARERDRASEASRMREESATRAEEQRRMTELLLTERQLEQDALLEGERREAELTRIAAEAEAKAQAERENEDVALRAMAARGEEQRRRTVEAITQVAHHIGRGATALLANPRQLGTLVGSIVAVCVGGFLAKEGATLGRQLLEAKLGRPKLVRETSRASRSLQATLLLSPFLVAWHLARLAKWFLALALGPRTWLKRLGRLWRALRLARRSGGRQGEWEGGEEGGKASAAEVRAMEVRGHFIDVVLPAALGERVQQLALATRNAKRNRVPYRHLLLYGPPGTGKTMVAQRLARASGMDYALMSGGDVGPLGKDAVTELHALFRWAKTSPNGLLLFVDEAEAFLGSRSRAAMSEELRNALNALLYQTGTQSYSFMMVLATNRAEDLDSAVLDRMDESLFLGLPELEKRTALVKQYFASFVTRHTVEARRAKEGRWSLRRLLRRVGWSALADLGLPPPLKVTLAAESPPRAKESGGGSNGGASTANGGSATGGGSGAGDKRAASKAKASKGGSKGSQAKGAQAKADAQAQAKGGAGGEAGEAADSKAEFLRWVAGELEGFSGREVSKLMVALQSAAYGSDDNTLTGDLIRTVVGLKVLEHRRKAEMVASLHESPRHSASSLSTYGHSGKPVDVPSSPTRSPNRRLSTN